ncbi:MAG: YdbL family protein [Gammaproteobacteria bacterium]|jgi:uncharacterized protein|nr:YdbL family protein [Gammaproteobacteria bacterium]MBT4812728.1 YdbL family protein [Thiotrichales bacterium]MBT7306784.1 YdbL family protein [Gammaproteobacteria bacterium]
MTPSVTPFTQLAALLLTLLFISAPLSASPLDEAKNSGYIGEKTNGYLGIVNKNAPASIKQLAETINLKRKKQYREIANKRNTPLNAVETTVGKKLLHRAQQNHHFYQLESGNWQR